MKKIFLLLFYFIATLTVAQIKMSVDFIISDAKIYTVNEQFSMAESMAVFGGKIVGIGSNLEIQAKFNSSKIYDAKGKPIYPGFIDAHCHFTGFAMDKWKCELYGTKSWEEILQKLQDYGKDAPQKWIYGRSWDQNDWVIKEFPDNKLLNELFPNRPVYLKRIDGHAAIANNKALEIAGITTETTITNGEIEQKEGKLTGILTDKAMDLVEKHIPEIRDDLALQYIETLQKECFSFGLTSVHDCGISVKTFELLEKAQQKKLLKMKIFALLEDQPETYDIWIPKGRFKKGNITFGGYKVYADGALGSRGACLQKDYADKPDWKGFLLSDENHFKNLAEKISKGDLQMCTHAIGDSANHVILNIYAEYLLGKNDKRWRIEHAQVVDPKDFELFGKYTIIPSVQPTHATSDMYWAETRIGNERLKTAYAYQDLLKQNGWLPLGTDFPVEQINPLKTFFAAVIRKDEQDFPQKGFQPENALTREQTLRGMTIWAAKAAFDEKEKGSLEVGKAADFVILNHDIMTIDENEILKTQVLETFVNGEKVYDYEGLPKK